ncbi:helicase associated domain-containing protein [Streptomyces sp. NPDC052287]|uniref:helicase associated domain-containing protein n=1 Tax=Streptomyces sp. NPDC052287 TaxID=3154950 RepID=UPI003423B650
MPYEHREGAFPLGTWVAEQRRAFGAGQMTGKAGAEAGTVGHGLVVADERFQENLAAARVYFEEHWTLCAPRSASALDKPGEVASNLRRPGALADRPEWETALLAVDEDWNPVWPANWQRHYAALRELLADEQGQASETEVLPGFTVHGMDVGKWLARQRTPAVWQGLAEGQRERLEQLGIRPLAPAPEPEAPATPSTAPVSAFERGVAALAQYKARTGTVTVPRSHEERIVVGGEEYLVKLGVFLSIQAGQTHR